MANNKSSIEKHEANNPDVIERTRSGIVFTPPVDIYETEKDMMLVADMPGVNEKSIDITIENNILCVQGSVEFEKPAEMDLQYAEYQIGDYKRSFTLNETINRDKIEANFKDGVLRLKLPKAEPAKPKKIEVKTI